MENYWLKQRKGANLFSSGPTPIEDLEAANEFGIEFFRLVPDKWQTEPPRLSPWQRRSL